ncbi:MAG: glucosidase, partial [Kofleriaceae bacterium]
MTKNTETGAKPIDKERDRVRQVRDDISGWRKWGPYLSDRAWGTVREDYSDNGDAWNFVTYDKARAKAYRWGEDGIAGISDRYQLLCFAPTFWNERDPHLKERLYGLNPNEGNHGEDVKDYYFHVDNTPTHSYMCLLYKYPQHEFPYRWLVEENQRRAGQGPEFELIDTGIFDDNRYFDVFIEYAKQTHEDISIRITAHNRGPDAAPLHIIPTLWFRNTWAWGKNPKPEPSIQKDISDGQTLALLADDGDMPPDRNMPPHYSLGMRWLIGPAEGAVLVTDNETHGERAYGPGNSSRKPYTKDAFHRAVCEGDGGAVKPGPNEAGTKAALHYKYMVPAGGSVTLRLRFTDGKKREALHEVDAIVDQRKAEADIFYAAIAPKTASVDEKLVQRRAFAGLLWTKQSYLFDVGKWFDGDNPDFPPPKSRHRIRNSHWRHLNTMRVMSMPDKWEYPWFAAWDLAFHCIPLAELDPEFAKAQLLLLTRE